MKIKNLLTTCTILAHWNSFKYRKILNFGTPEIFAIIYLKFKQRGQTLEYFVKMMPMEKQTVKTLIRLLL